MNDVLCTVQPVFIGPVCVAHSNISPKLLKQTFYNSSSEVYISQSWVKYTYMTL